VKNLPTVLVVDDETSIRQLCVRILEAGGYQVCTAANGLDAPEVLESGTDVDCVVIDLIMPKMTGLTLGIKLHEAHPTLPTVIISGKIDLEADSIKALAAMMNSDTRCLLQKPFTAEQLLDAVRLALTRDCPEPKGDAPI
jgi:CheY-like chemotaxis protein